MIALMNGVRSGRQVLRNAGQIRSVSVGMPRNFIPWSERVIHGIVIACSILATPAYIATNIKHYRGNPE